MYIKSILEAKGSALICVSPHDSVRRVAELFKRERIGFALINHADQPTVGSISERDIVQAMAERGDVSDLPVTDIMTTNIASCGIDSSVDAVRELMTNERTRHVLVLDGQAKVGIVSIGDIIKHSLTECKVDTGLMREYIAGQGYQ